MQCNVLNSSSDLCAQQPLIMNFQTASRTCPMARKEVVLRGSVTDVSRPGIYPGVRNLEGFIREADERVTFSVEGAEPLWAELRIPNKHGWFRSFRSNRCSSRKRRDSLAWRPSCCPRTAKLHGVCLHVSSVSTTVSALPGLVANLEDCLAELRSRDFELHSPLF